MEIHEMDVVSDGARTAMEEVCNFARSEFEIHSEDVGGYSSFGDGVSLGWSVFTTTVFLHFDFDDVGVRSVPPPHRLMNQ